MERIAFLSLGCDKNRVDSEYMLGLLRKNGHEITQDPQNADVVVINTCAFLEASRAEAVDTILAYAKEKREEQKLVVAGCLPEKYIEDLKESLPEVDGFLGTEAREQLLVLLEELRLGRRVSLVGGVKEESFSEHERVLTTPENVAYLKIADGCDNRCTYCLIPSIRGKYRSVPLADLEREARELAEHGVTELILVAQDLTRYGSDLIGSPGLVGLIRTLSKIDSIVWIRLLYCYPESVSDELIAEIRDNPKVCNYIDIPLQHVSDRVLKRMGRRSSKSQIERLIDKLRREIPDISIRSTFIVGFPGETEDEFSELLTFLSEHELDHAGFFAYSDEEDAPSFRLNGKIPEAEKERRLLQAISISEEIQGRKFEAWVGKRVLAVCDGVDFEIGRFVGRTEGQSLDVDPRLLLSGDCEIESGTYYQVEITGRDGEDLTAKIL